MSAVYKAKKICRTFDERRNGMMNDTLASDEVCVFVYERPHSPRFWCKDTPQDLYVSIVSDGIVLDCVGMKAYDETPVTLDGSGNIAIESIFELPIGANVSIEDDKVMVSDAALD